MLKVVYGEGIHAARVDLWASSLGQVDARSSARSQNLRHQVGKTGGRFDWVPICGMTISGYVSNISCGRFRRISSPEARA